MTQLQDRLIRNIQLVKIAELFMDRQIVVPSRIRTFLQNTGPRVYTLPVSCTSFKPGAGMMGLLEAIQYCAEALRRGAAVNVHLDNFAPFPPVKHKIRVTLDPLHPDWDNFSGLVSAENRVSHRALDTGKYKAQTVKLQDSMDTVDNTRGVVGIVPGLSRAAAIAINEDVVADFTNLRSQGKPTSGGGTSSGPAYFADLYIQVAKWLHDPTLYNYMATLSTTVAHVKKGGPYKNGVITTSMPCNHPLIEEYIDIPNNVAPWIRQGIVIGSNFVGESHLVDKVINATNRGTLWLEKAINKDGNYMSEPTEEGRLLSNVCREVLLDSRGTCMLAHINLGQIEYPIDIPPAMARGMEALCQLHDLNPQSESPIYLSAKQDKQVGLGLVGLANMLAKFKVSYAEFTQALEYVLGESKQTPHPLPLDLAKMLVKGYQVAADVAKGYNMERAFCIAPTASCSFNETDLDGYSLTPEISPPIARSVERVSEHIESKVYLYPPTVEIASEVGFETYSKLVNAIQTIMNSTGLAHSISFNIHEDIDDVWLEWFNESNIRTTYYRMNVDTKSQDKADQFDLCGLKPGECSSCAE